MAMYTLAGYMKKRFVKKGTIELDKEDETAGAAVDVVGTTTVTLLRQTVLTCYTKSSYLR